MEAFYSQLKMLKKFNPEDVKRFLLQMCNFLIKFNTSNQDFHFSDESKQLMIAFTNALKNYAYTRTQIVCLFIDFIKKKI